MESVSCTITVSKKKILLVIGNGFDLHCGLRSSYSHFFEHEGKKTFDDIVKKHYLDQRFTKATRDENIAKDIIGQFGDSNLWLLYFLGKIYSEADRRSGNWCDIETMIDEFVEAKDRMVFSLSRIAEGEKLTPNSDWFTKSLAKIVDRDRKDKIFKNDREFYNYLFNQLQIFERRFGKYLEEICHDDQDYLNNASTFLKKLVGDEEVVLIDSFNYTNPFPPKPSNEIMAPHQIKVCNIHGDTKSPIFGIYPMSDDALGPGDLANSFTKLCRQVASEIKARNISYEDIDEVVVYGHSLNEQDQSYFNSLFDDFGICDRSKKKPKFIFAFSIFKEPDPTEKSAADTLSENIFNLFARYGKRKGDNSIMQDLASSGRLEIKRIDD